MKEEALRRLEEICWLVAVAGVIAAQYMIFLVVPNERVMGPVQRIFYFHVGSAVACYCAFGIVLLASLGYLATRREKYDLISHAAGEVGFVFCTVVIATGMIWGHSAWNTWFRWEPRLVTFLVLWLIFLSFNLLRAFGEVAKIRQHSAVLGILGAITVPIVVFSINLLPQFAQLHPQIIGNRGLKDDSYIYTLFFSMAVLVILSMLLIRARYRIAALEHSYLKIKG